MAIKTFDGASSSGFTLPSQTGNSGKVFTTDGTTATWQIPILTLIASGNVQSGNTLTFSNIPQTYKHLRIIAGGTGGTAELKLRFNAAVDTFNSTYHQYSSASAVSGGAISNGLLLGNFQTGWGHSSDINIPNYSSTTLRKTASAHVGGSGGNVGHAICGGSGQFTTAISQVEFYTSNAFSDYTAYLYGWN